MKRIMVSNRVLRRQKALHERHIPNDVRLLLRMRVCDAK